MSLTPMEIMSQRYGVKRSRGDVLVGGLGMGWLTRRVLQRKAVKHVTIIEKDQRIIDIFGQKIVNDFGNRVDIICDDVWNVIDVNCESPANVYDTVLIDIWEDANGREYDRNFVKLRNKHGRVWGWGRTMPKERW